MRVVNEHKEMEERLLRRIDWLRRDYGGDTATPDIDYRWLAIAQTHLEQAFMALNRAVFCPERIKLPEDNNG